MEIRFDDYNAYPDSDITAVSAEGVELSTGQFISFADCAANFHSVHGGSGKCVGERDITDRSIAFYTAPLTTHLVFVDRGWFRPSAEHRFLKFCRKITEAGYTTLDES